MGCASLAGKCLTLPDTTVVLPGHGPATTIGRERGTNPYLAEADAQAAQAGGRVPGPPPAGRGL